MSSWSKKCGLVVRAGLSSVAGCTAPAAVTDGGSADAPTGDRVSTPSPDVALSDGGTCVDMDNDGHPSAACGGDGRSRLALALGKAVGAGLETGDALLVAIAARPLAELAAER
jgi:hypothetical protein